MAEPSVFEKCLGYAEVSVCHQARQKGAQRGSLHGVNDRAPF